jgi:putative transposase
MGPRQNPRLSNNGGIFHSEIGFCELGTEYHHGALGLLTPANVHYGRTFEVLAARQQVLTASWHAHPDPFVRGPLLPASPPGAVWINPPRPASEEVTH